jgi:hypothetical protein
MLVLAAVLILHCRPTGSNPFHPSRCPLAAILPLFLRPVQLPIPLGLNLLLMPGEHVLWSDVADGTVQANVRTSPYYPQSNGKIERWHKSLKSECIRPGTPLSLEDARRLVEGYVEHYNNVRLDSAIGYITPKDMLARHQQEIQAERDRKLDAAKEHRKNRRQRAA